MRDEGLESTVTASSSTDRSPRREVPWRVGRYEIREPLGSGAMGVVYAARDPELDRIVAIKLVHTRGEHRSSDGRLLREAQAMARLRHPNVVPIFDVGVVNGAVFVAMPLLECGTLRRWLRGPGAAHSPAAILDRFVAAGHGLAAAHAAGLVHRDFKPENVLLGADGEVSVADFGLARLAAEGAARSDTARPDADLRSQTGDVVGTPAYMSPEQLCGRRSDARSDQFSFCVSLWEGLHGTRPFHCPPSGTPDPMGARLEAIAAGPVRPPLRRDCPAWIGPLLLRGLALEPANRWPSMQALLDAIAAHRAPRRWPWWFAAGAGAIGLAIAILALARTEPAPRYRLAQLTERDDIKQASISPDGRMLAVVAGDSFVIRGINPDAEDRVVIEHGVNGNYIAWSPDSKHLLVDTMSEGVTRIETQLIDVERGTRSKLSQPGMSAFLSNTEIAVASPRQRTVAVFRLNERTATRTCTVPGDYTFIWEIVGLPDGTIVAETRKGKAYTLVFLRPDCQHRTYAGAFSSVAASDAGTVVALVADDGFGELLEISVEGELLARRWVSGDLEKVIGRRDGIDYVTTRTVRTHLARLHGTDPPDRLFSDEGSASFSLSPDGRTLAWIELDGRTRGPLRLSTLDAVSRRGRSLHDKALSAGWSPDGRSLAVQIKDDHAARVEIIVIDRSGAVRRRLPLDHLEPGVQPVWLDDHRIAAQTVDRTTYRWFDLNTEAQGDVVDRAYGSTYSLARSPRDGTLAMWRNGRPDAIDADTEHLWLKAVGEAARPLHLARAPRHHLAPSWSPSGELYVRAFETGVISRVALDTGELTPVAQLSGIPLTSVLGDDLMTSAEGELLAVDIEYGINVATVHADDPRRPRAPPDRGRDPR